MNDPQQLDATTDQAAAMGDTGGRNQSAAIIEGEHVGRAGGARRRRGKPDGVFRKGGAWWLDYYDAEGRRRRTKASPDYRTAVAMYRDIKTRIAKGERLGIREEGLRLREFVEGRYWPAIKPNLSSDEQTRARAILDSQVLPRFGGVKLSKLRREDIERWAAERLTGANGGRAVAKGTVNKELIRLGHVLNRAVEWGYLKASPARGIKKPKVTDTRTRTLTPEEHDVLLNGRDATVTASDGRTWTVHHGPSPALRLYILAALQTAARRGELCRLTWQDVDFRTGSLTFQKTKNGHPRTVPMTATLRAALLALPRPLDPEAPVFPERDPKVLSRSFARLVRRLGIAGLRFHDLRHDAASTLTMAGVPQKTVMEILGHRDPRMTIRYQHPSEEHRRVAMRALDTRPHEAREGESAAAR